MKIHSGAGTLIGSGSIENTPRGYPPCPSAIKIFKETFKSSSIGSIPEAWYVKNPGRAMAVSNNRAQEGSKSQFMQGMPYGGQICFTIFPT
jgi:hypothetical protein